VSGLGSFWDYFVNPFLGGGGGGDGGSSTQEFHRCRLVKI